MKLPDEARNFASRIVWPKWPGLVCFSSSGSYDDILIHTVLPCLSLPCIIPVHGHERTSLGVDVQWHYPVRKLVLIFLHFFFSSFS